MGEAAIIGLVLQYGIPFAEYLITTLQKKGTVAPEDWAALKSLANITAKGELLLRLQANGVDPASEQGKALLAMVQ